MCVLTIGLFFLLFYLVLNLRFLILSYSAIIIIYYYYHYYHHHYYYYYNDNNNNNNNDNNNNNNNNSNTSNNTVAAAVVGNSVFFPNNNKNGTGVSCVKTASTTAESRMNLAALQQRDPYITDIVDTAKQVALYFFSSKESEWIAVWQNGI